MKNRSSDRKQYKKYKEILGDEISKTLDDFQDMKYTDSDKWKVVNTKYKDALLQEKIRSNSVDKDIHLGKQGKHIPGHNNYKEGRSYLTISVEKAQELVNKYAGTGRIIRDSSGKYLNKEKITTKEQIGIYVDLEGNSTATKSFIIHYAQKGVHIVPTGDAK